MPPRESLLAPKILQFGKFYPPDIGGIESVMGDIVRGIAAKGLICDVLCANSSGSFSYEITKQDTRIFRAKSYGKLASTAIAPQMLRLTRKLIQPYDIIHAHLPDPMANLALFCARDAAKNKIIILHWHSDIIKQKRLLRLYAPLQEWLLQRCDYIITTSPKYAVQSAVLPRFRHKVVSIPIGIESLDSPNPRCERALADFLQSLGTKKLILSIGRLAENKGFEYLIRAAAMLGDEYVVAIGGEGALHGDLKGLIKRLNLQNKVFLLGKIERENLAAIYLNSFIFVLPSIQESYGIVLLEAMSVGKPVICTHLSPSGSDWINQHESSGIVVPPKNHRAIAEAIWRISRDYEYFSRNAKQRFEAGFRLETMIDSLYGLYLRAAKGAQGGGT